MRILMSGVLATTALCAACSEAGDDTKQAEYVTTADVAMAPPADYAFSEPSSESSAMRELPPPPPARVPASTMGTESSTAGPGIPAIPVGMPKVAYRYSYGFRLPADGIKPLQERHADMCENKGPDLCRIISMEQVDEEGDYSSGSLTLAVAAGEARRFGKDLSAATGKADGELIASSIEGEDLSKRIVDTEARLRARSILRDRLMEVLRSRKGTVAELVEAERGVAQVNEEIDQARSWLTEMRSRVAFSQMEIAYSAGTPSSGGFTDPIRDAWGAIGKILGNLVAFLILVVTVLLPLGLLVWLAVRLWRRMGLSSGIGEGWTPADKAEAEQGA
ncbi:DUF4349 domain-containing protein [Qipengyuania marisflavi]|uniref:DUF4349 domain-containing protein n=1 Tax=Qipengyuania marisflavi TaxID=2486356 RepID=A0A5S3P6W9_9SPHN|nr:DUF4349 domain-containing protein [Qipengyuania marisflavi]TMM48875.1 DUF4349 domain-containing protein [Qipengyuania marisflavi]